MADPTYARSVAVRYWEQGLTIAAIAKQDHVSVSAVRAVMQAWHIPRRSGRDAGHGAGVVIPAIGDLLP